MARWWQIPQVFVRYWVDWGTDHSIWCIRIGRSFLRGYMARKESEREFLEIFLWVHKIFKGHWISAVTSLKRSKNAKDCMTNNDWRWTQTYPSQTTSQATTWSTIRRPRKIRLPTWSSRRMAILSFFQDDAFIFVIALATKQQLEVKSKLGSVANIILDWTVIFPLCSEMSFCLPEM